jgi:hypothetical protein
MEKREKIRKHIVIPEKNDISFSDIIVLFAGMVEDILEDEIIPFAFINYQGLMVGSESALPVEDFVYDDGTLFRAFSKKGRWRISAVRREEDGPVTFVELLAPCDTADKIEDAVHYISSKIKGAESVV